MIPVQLFCIGNMILRMVPTFRVMQERIDELNMVLREQITGIRVVRAFVRERFEISGSTSGQRPTSLQQRPRWPMMGLMFPTVTVIINLNSVAVIWFGAVQVDNGDMRSGSLIAFLTRTSPRS